MELIMMLSFPFSSPVGMRHDVFWKTRTLNSIFRGSIITPNIVFWRSMHFSSPLTCCSHFWCMHCWPQASLCGSLKRRHIFSEPVMLSCLTSSFPFIERQWLLGLQWYKFSTGVSCSCTCSFRLPSTNSHLHSRSAWVTGPAIGSWKKKQASSWQRTIYWMILYHVSAWGNMSLNHIHCSFSIDVSGSCVIAWLCMRFAFFEVNYS